ncbi:DNA-binding transcriptional regulator, AcrR family [Pustulibacterium marinum]|uniref:DNA-binding transcriptional regulator, AcrR family n=1 Tax=Pustulibacterium marinum TaxID=1224947 RepID=A0A1I7F8Y6_9FLAO|nr:TetR family transcriptional regulator C-terminal domain-containing protein [Pustulibacterium marinum]SFU32637.1 DNA-binding transcriptional regulator, AcrR family [Pustulibacterium marinum]
MAKTKKITEDDIISAYMNFVLEHERAPKTVFKFSKEIKIKEEDFYQFFGSIEAVQKKIWTKFFTNTKDLLEKNEEYESMSTREKMLTFFFTYFEMLTLNRSYILFVLKEHENVLKSLSQLKNLRKEFKDFVAKLAQENNEGKNYKFLKQSPQLVAEGSWLQLMFLMKFWMNDDSQGFERTDVAIEKSVNTIFDVFDHTPIESLIDFGKFLIKEAKASV